MQTDRPDAQQRYDLHDETNHDQEERHVHHLNQFLHRVFSFDLLLVAIPVHAINPKMIHKSDHVMSNNQRIM
jgi:hypothetical protein